MEFSTRVRTIVDWEIYIPSIPYCAYIPYQKENTQYDIAILIDLLWSNVMHYFSPTMVVETYMLVLRNNMTGKPTHSTPNLRNGTTCLNHKLLSKR